MVGVQVRSAEAHELATVADVYVDAFPGTEGPQIAQLVRDLLSDPTASPLLSLVAEVDGRIVGHVLLTRASIDPADQATSVRLLAPLAVRQDHQRRGIGGRLIEQALARSTRAGVQLVFVLGHPAYYPRFGFRPAGEFGLDAPFPIAAHNAPAWMVHALEPGVIGRVRGVVRCAASLNHPEYWTE